MKNLSATSLLFIFVCGLLALQHASAKKFDRIGAQPEGIIGGQKAGKGRFPWMVWLQNKEKNIQCGASIISSLHLITASHCLLNKSSNGFADVRNLFAFAGITDVHNSFEIDSQKSEIELIRHHPNYDMKKSTYEIAILKLMKPLVWTPFVRPIRYANEIDKNKLFGEKMVALGWGNTDKYGPNGKPSLHLNYATLIGIDCQSWNEFLGEDIVCVQGRNYENICSGDSGGPIICKDSFGKEYLCGYSSRSYCEKGFGVIGRINYYTTFIHQALKMRKRVHLYST